MKCIQCGRGAVGEIQHHETCELYSPTPPQPGERVLVEAIVRKVHDGFVLVTPDKKSDGIMFVPISAIRRMEGKP